MAISNFFVSGSRLYKNAVEQSFYVARGSAECLAATGSVVTESLFAPIRSCKEIAKICLGYYDFQKAGESLSTAETQAIVAGRIRMIRRPVSERISVGVGHSLVGGVKAITSLMVTKNYIEGVGRNLLTNETGSQAQVFADGVNAAVGVLGKTVSTVAQGMFAAVKPLGKILVENPDSCIILGMRTGFTGGCLYLTSYGVVHSSDSNRLLGKIYYSGIAALGLLGAFYTSGLNQVFCV
jgi:hypothetical protein